MRATQNAQVPLLKHIEADRALLLLRAQLLVNLLHGHALLALSV